MLKGHDLPEISTIEVLVSALETGTDTEELIQRLNLIPETYLSLCHWQTDKYARIPVSRTKTYELVLVCWEPGQGAEAHNHDRSECRVKVLQGELTETVYLRKTDGKSIQIRRTGEVTYIDDTVGIHSMFNHTKNRVISLHLYTPPIDRFNYYDTTTGAVTKTVELNS